MKKTDEHILRATKEIIVKFIEMGRLSPSTVNESFQQIYSGIHSTVTRHSHDSHENKAQKGDQNNET